MIETILEDKREIFSLRYDDKFSIHVGETYIVSTAVKGIVKKFVPYKESNGDIFIAVVLDDNEIPCRIPANRVFIYYDVKS